MSTNLNLDSLPPVADRRSQDDIRQWMDRYLGQFDDIDERLEHAETIRQTLHRAWGRIGEAA